MSGGITGGSRQQEEMINACKKRKQELLAYKFGDKTSLKTFEAEGIDVSDMKRVVIAVFGPTGSGKTTFIGTAERTLLGPDNQTAFGLGHGSMGTFGLQDYLSAPNINLLDTPAFFNFTDEKTATDCLNIMTGKIRAGDNFNDKGVEAFDVSARSIAKFGDQVHVVIIVIRASDQRLKCGEYLNEMKKIRDLIHSRFHDESPITVITHEDTNQNDEDRQIAFQEASAATGSPIDRTYFITNYTSQNKDYSLKTEKQVLDILDTALLSAERFVKIQKLRDARRSDLRRFFERLQAEYKWPDDKVTAIVKKLEEIEITTVDILKKCWDNVKKEMKMTIGIRQAVEKAVADMRMKDAKTLGEAMRRAEEELEAERLRSGKKHEENIACLKLKQELLAYKFGNKLALKSFEAEGYVSDMKRVVIALFGPAGSGKTSFIGTAERTLFGPDKQTAFGDGICGIATVVLEKFLPGLNINLLDTRGFCKYSDYPASECFNIMTGKMRDSDVIIRKNDNGELGKASKVSARPMANFGDQVHAVIFVIQANDERLKSGKYLNELKEIRDLIHSRFQGESPITVITHEDEIKKDEDRRIAFQEASAATGSRENRTFFITNYTSQNKDYSLKTEKQVLDILDAALVSAERFVIFQKMVDARSSDLRRFFERLRAEYKWPDDKVATIVKKLEEMAITVDILKQCWDDVKKEVEMTIGIRQAVEKAVADMRMKDAIAREEQEEKTACLELKKELLAYKFGNKLSLKTLDANGYARDMKKVVIALFGPAGSGKTSFIGTAERTLLGPDKQRAFGHGAGGEGDVILQEFLFTPNIKLLDTRGFMDVSKDTASECINILTGRSKVGDVNIRNSDKDIFGDALDISARSVANFGDQVHAVIFVVKANDERLKGGIYLNRMKKIKDVIHFRFEGESPITVITHEDEIKNDEDRQIAFQEASAATGSPIDRTFFITNYTSRNKDYSLKTEKQVLDILDTALLSAEGFVKIQKPEDIRHFFKRLQAKYKLPDDKVNAIIEQLDEMAITTVDVLKASWNDVEKEKMATIGIRRAVETALADIN